MGFVPFRCWLREPFVFFYSRCFLVVSFGCTGDSVGYDDYAHRVGTFV